MITRIFLASIALPLISQAGWPQFRGPNGSGVAEGPVPPAELKEDNILWKIDLPGRGLSSPVIVGDQVFLSAASGPKQERLHIMALSTKDGKKLWERQFEATGRTMSHEKTCVAAPTPCSDGKLLFVTYSSNDLVCLDLDGRLKWLRGLTLDYPNASNSLGMASSPLVVDGTLITMLENDSDSFTVGIDVKTGKNIWKLPRPKIANWTSPVSFTANGKSTVALISKDGVVAVDPVTGSQLWKLDGGTTTPSCAVAGNTLFVPSNGTTAYDLSKIGTAPEQLWQSAQLNNATSSPVASGDFVYTINGAGVLAKAKAIDGEQVWKLRLGGKFSGSPVVSGNLVCAVSEEGNLKVVDTTTPEGTLTTDLKLGGTLLCTPAISDGCIYVRSDATLWKLGAKP
jgi:outer membrane protein assembly factor BamB